MKSTKKIIHWVAGILCLTVFIACSNNEDFGRFTPEVPTISFGAKSVVVSKDGGTYEVPLSSNLPWRSKATQPWVDSLTTQGAGNETIRIKVQKNTTILQRTANIVVWITNESTDTLSLVQEAGNLPPETKKHIYAKPDGSGDGTSWEKATKLSSALKMELYAGDFIHLAAGTYRPTNIITGGDPVNNKDLTFEISANIQLIGGYTANPQSAEQPNPQINSTILSGLLIGGTKVNHVVTVAAPLASGQKVHISGITIRDGDANQSGSITTNGLSYPKNYAAGIIIIGANVAMDNCIITDNQGTGHGIGLYVYSGASLVMEKCRISNNTGATSNGVGMYIRSATAALNNCTIENNKTDGVGCGIQTFGSADVRIYNSTISNNLSGSAGTANRGAAGIYNRDGSNLLLANCTLYGNSGTGNGGAILTHASSVTTLISCTVTANNGLLGGGIFNTAGCTVQMYNSIISGNTNGTNHSDVSGTFTYKYVIEGDKTYDKNGVTLTGAAFDPASMLDKLKDNGGPTQTCRLIGTGNPALTNGMSSTELYMAGNQFSPAVPEQIISTDQKGSSRNGIKTIGALVN